MGWLQFILERCAALIRHKYELRSVPCVTLQDTGLFVQAIGKLHCDVQRPNLRITPGGNYKHYEHWKYGLA